MYYIYIIIQWTPLFHPLCSSGVLTTVSTPPIQLPRPNLPSLRWTCLQCGSPTDPWFKNSANGKIHFWNHLNLKSFECFEENMLWWLPIDSIKGPTRGAPILRRPSKVSRLCFFLPLVGSCSIFWIPGGTFLASSAFTLTCPLTCPFNTGMHGAILAMAEKHKVTAPGLQYQDLSKML